MCAWWPSSAGELLPLGSGHSGPLASVHQAEPGSSQGLPPSPSLPTLAADAGRDGVRVEGLRIYERSTGEGKAPERRFTRETPPSLKRVLTPSVPRACLIRPSACFCQ